MLWIHFYSNVLESILKIRNKPTKFRLVIKIDETIFKKTYLPNLNLTFLPSFIKLVQAW